MGETDSAETQSDGPVQRLGTTLGRQGAEEGRAVGVPTAAAAVATTTAATTASLRFTELRVGAGSSAKSFPHALFSLLTAASASRRGRVLAQQTDKSHLCKIPRFHMVQMALWMLFLLMNLAWSVLVPIAEFRVEVTTCV